MSCVSRSLCCPSGLFCAIARRAGVGPCERNSKLLSVTLRDRDDSRTALRIGSIKPQKLVVLAGEESGNSPAMVESFVGSVTLTRPSVREDATVAETPFKSERFRLCKTTESPLDNGKHLQSRTLPAQIAVQTLLSQFTVR